MGKPVKVLWGEGMFLRPQHFQRFNADLELQVLDVRRTQQPYFFGLDKIEFDEHALQQGVLKLLSLSAVFQDGARVELPQQGPLPPIRDLKQVPVQESGTTLYVCLPSFNLHGSNAANETTDSASHARFVTCSESSVDWFTRAVEAPVTGLHFNIRLMTEQENRDGMLVIAAARIHKMGTAWKLDPAFMPTAISVEANVSLKRKLHTLLGMLQQKSASLSAQHRQRTEAVSEFGTNDIASFWLLHSVNRLYPAIRHLSSIDTTHPEALYRVLAAAAGELLTFSQQHDVSEIPLYHHESPLKTFEPLFTLIHRMIDTVIGERYVVLPLNNPKNSFFVAHILDERMLDEMDFYLSVQSERPAREISDIVPVRLKIGSPDDVELIVNSALSGVSLLATQQVPAGIPVRVSNQYFALDPKSPLYAKMLTSRSICIYVPQPLSDLKIELIGVYR